jgi:hypothetical protein
VCADRFFGLTSANKKMNLMFLVTKMESNYNMPMIYSADILTGRQETQDTSKTPEPQNTLDASQQAEISEDPDAPKDLGLDDCSPQNIGPQNANIQNIESQSNQAKKTIDFMVPIKIGCEMSVARFVCRDVGGGMFFIEITAGFNTKWAGCFPQNMEGPGGDSRDVYDDLSEAVTRGGIAIHAAIKGTIIGIDCGRDRDATTGKTVCFCAVITIK